MNGPHPDSPAVAEQLRHLQSLLIATLIGLVIMAMAVAFFIEKQTRLVKQQVAEQRPTINRMMTEYQKGHEPLIRNFSSALAQFAATNRDFQSIIEKYRPVLSNYFGAPLPVAVPATGAVSAPVP